jgi:hypothetical protein
MKSTREARHRQRRPRTERASAWPAVTCSPKGRRSASFADCCQNWIYDWPSLPTLSSRWIRQVRVSQIEKAEANQ